jgi:hypothetical protein
MVQTGASTFAGVAAVAFGNGGLFVVSDFGSFVALFVPREFVNPELVATPCSPFFPESPVEEGAEADSEDLKRASPEATGVPTDPEEEAALETTTGDLSITAAFDAVEGTAGVELLPEDRSFVVEFGMTLESKSPSVWINGAPTSSKRMITHANGWALK